MASPRGYAAEIEEIEAEIAACGDDAALEPPTDAARVTRYVWRLYQRASLAGDFAGLATAERAAARAVPLLAHPGDLYLLRANIALKLHRLDHAEAALAAVSAVWDSAEGRLIRGDLDFQRGRYSAAKRGYCAVISVERSWGALARLAYFAGKMGDPRGADRLYAEAEDELSAKELRAYAWLEVQRGHLDFAHGCGEAARAHYRQAERAYPGYWLVREHAAELLGAEGRYTEAIAILEELGPGSGRPDLAQAIAELHELTGDAAQARRWAREARAGYLRSARRGEVHFQHHLADYYTEVARDGARAVLWARRDLELRRNFATEAALAAALHLAGRFDEARCWIDRALASGAVDARLFLLAGDIHAAAGNAAAARDHRERAIRLNPLVGCFHLHH
jgi:tetratricopeptide (TPR) repeat protein